MLSIFTGVSFKEVTASRDVKLIMLIDEHIFLSIDKRSIGAMRYLSTADCTIKLIRH